MSTIYRNTWTSPIGELHLYADDEHLLAICFDANDEAVARRLRLHPSSAGENTHIQKAKEQLKEYFAGERKAFDLPLRFQGTEFQRKAWTALLAIPYGTCLNYSSQAESMEHPTAVRAVGAANGQNPYSIVIPCHRVIGKNGKLTGYAGGEAMKASLLKLEGFTN